MKNEKNLGVKNFFENLYFFVVSAAVFAIIMTLKHQFQKWDSKLDTTFDK